MNTFKKILYHFFPYKNYTAVVLRNSFKRKTQKIPQNKYLFILSLPNSGSTLLSEILTTSKNISANNTQGTREGQTLPTVRKLMFDHDERWDEKLVLDWTYIQSEWRKHWDVTRPVLLEKSPPNLVRTSAIAAHFQPSYFIILVRNPYAVCDGFLNRKKNIWEAEAAAKFVIKQLKLQRKNTEQLSNQLLISYEFLTTQPTEFKRQLSAFLPEIADVKTDITFNAHSKIGQAMPLQNLNPIKINRLTFTQIKTINTVFLPEKETLNYFKFPILRK